MKLIHISDLHLGKSLNSFSLLEDQEYILDQIAGIADREKADAVLIAGDVYQRQAPQAEAMALFDRFVTRLTAGGHKVIVISGNHDSEQRVAYFSALIRSAGVYSAPQFDGKMDCVTLNDEYGKINFWLLPYVRPQQVCKLTGAKELTFKEAVKTVLDAHVIDTRERNVILCHQFVTGSERCDSEEKSVGGLDNIDASLFDLFDYAALGHIHKPQAMTRPTLRYAGSPLKYSLSEVQHKKSVTLIDMREKGCVDVKTEQLHPLRDVRIVKGRFEEIMRMPYSEDYVGVVLTDELVPADALYSLRNVMPNILHLSVENSKTSEDIFIQEAEDIHAKSTLELFRDFYREQMNGVEPTPEHIEELTKILEKLEGSAE